MADKFKSIIYRLWQKNTKSYISANGKDFWYSKGWVIERAKSLNYDWRTRKSNVNSDNYEVHTFRVVLEKVETYAEFSKEIEDIKAAKQLAIENERKAKEDKKKEICKTFTKFTTIELDFYKIHEMYLSNKLVKELEDQLSHLFTQLSILK